jgi:two-component sensor histidine kinase
MNPIDQIPCPVMVSDIDGYILEVNQNLLEVVGGETSTWLGQPMDKLVSMSSRIFLQTHVWPILLKDGQLQEVKLHMLDKQGAQIPVLTNCQISTQSEKHRCHWVFFVSQDRSRFEGELLQAKKQAESALERLQISEVALKQSLRDKEALIMEVHHRVKNNLQVITSLLRLESGRSEVAVVKAVLGDMQSRIRTMSMLHESLYRSGTSASVELGSYLRKLSTQAFQSQAASSDAVRLELHLESVLVSMDQAVTCGLLVNELISNCFKHGFPAELSGFISVNLQQLDTDAQWCLRVSDSGVGLPENFEDKRKKSLGLQLVADLVRQIGGKLTITPNLEKGVTFAVNFNVIQPGPVVMAA